MSDLRRRVCWAPPYISSCLSVCSPHWRPWCYSCPPTSLEWRCRGIAEFGRSRSRDPALIDKINFNYLFDSDQNVSLRVSQLQCCRQSPPGSQCSTSSAAGATQDGADTRQGQAATTTWTQQARESPSLTQVAGVLGVPAIPSALALTAARSWRTTLSAAGACAHCRQTETEEQQETRYCCTHPRGQLHTDPYLNIIRIIHFTLVLSLSYLRFVPCSGFEQRQRRLSSIFFLFDVWFITHFRRPMINMWKEQRLIIKWEIMK